MEAFGTVAVYAYTSDARLPVSGARVVITDDLSPESPVLAEKFTDRSGYIPPVRLPAPEKYGSQEPDRKDPFFTVAVTIQHPGFETERVEGVQVFPDTVTVQSFRMIPVLPGKEESHTLDTVPQDL